MNLNKRIGGPGLLAVILGSIVVFILFLGGSVFVNVLFLLAFGWPSYLNRVVPQLNPDPWVVGMAIVCFVGFGLGSHAFLKWLYLATATEPRTWKSKWSACVVGLIVLMFTAGIAVIGMIHQTSWIVRSPEALTRGTR